MNPKNERIFKLWNKGIRDPKIIAKKLGLLSIERVMVGLKWLQDEHRIYKEIAIPNDKQSTEQVQSKVLTAPTQKG